MKQYRFSAEKDREFSKTLRKRVNGYFKENNISKNANGLMVVKIISALALYLVPWLLFVTGIVTNTYTIFALWILMGVGVASVGTTVMHDCLHGSFSSNKKTNQFMELFAYLIAVYPLMWKLQHNVLHHTYTNIEDADEDLDPRFFMRFAPNQKKRWFHNYQHIYATLLYCFPTLMWITVKDFIKLKGYVKLGLVEKKAAFGHIIGLAVHKIIYLIIFLGIPLMTVDIPAWLTIVMFFIMHAMTGILLSYIFQTAHVMPETSYVSQESTEISENREVHQLMTTANFAENDKLFFWLFGGLNFQIEHHLFPNISHVHYPALAHIVRDTATEYGIAYRTEPSFGVAIARHHSMLKTLGQGGNEFAAA